VKIRTPVWVLGFALTFGLCCGGVPAVAQQSASSTAVHMVVSVESRHGAEIPAINREDVMVNEGHDRDKVTAWVPATGANSGLDLYIVLDDSSAWSVDTQLAEMRQFIMQQPSSTYVAVGYMSNGTVRTAQSLTTEHAAAAKALRLTTGNPTGAASPYFSLEDLLKHWQPDPSRPRREVIMVTNGIDLYSPGTVDPYLDEAIDKIQRAGILVYSIYTPGTGHSGHTLWRINWGQDNLSRLSDETGAESYDLGLVPGPSFKPYFDDISKRLTHQYLLTFIPKPEKKAGMQSVKLMTEVPDAELVGPRRVYVPASSNE
jgi:hypothetical protein